MKWFKLADVFLNLLLIGWLVYKAGTEGKDLLVTSYLYVGAWQSVSMIIHASLGWFVTKGNTRYVYHWVAFVSVISLPLGPARVLFFAAPFMALFYTVLSIIELKYLYRKRPLSVLK